MEKEILRELQKFNEKFGVLTCGGETGFRFEHIFRVLEIYAELKCAVLGGDVYTKKGDTYVPAYANWNVDREENETFEQYVQRSILYAKNYINDYQHKERDIYVLCPQ